MTKCQQPSQENPSPLTQLRQQMAVYFSLEELRTLCFDLHVNYDELPNPGLTPKIRDLIRLLKQNDSIHELHTVVSQARPHITWPTLAALEADTLTDTDSLTSPAPQVTVSAQGEGAVAVGPRGVYVGGDVYGNIHTGDVINYYVTGAQTFYPQFMVGIQNFLTNYLGTDEKPVPFGGRDRQLSQLNNWLTQEERQRLLLVAPAGRGKSALLVRWSQQLTQVDNLAVVFMPISLRFNTNREDNTFVLLATRLAHFYGKQIPTSYANQSPQMWRGLVAEYLREPLPDGRQLLLILDGLDEAAWDVAADLLPLDLPATTRVVASARYLGGEEQSPMPWLRRLGWDSLPESVETIELGKLTQTGVRDVLQKMGCPLDELGRNVDIVAEMYRLSEGAPLLVELYVKDLWSQRETVARLKPENLQNIEPGYRGYFDRWWTEQKRLWGAERPLQEQLVRAILNLMTMAYGPLLVEDIQDLLPETIGADGILIREAITPLARFVIGDGKEQGFAFSHPKLADYFREQLTQRDRKMWHESFLAWGEQILTDLRAERVKPYDVADYLMLHYGRHLEAANAEIDRFLKMVSWQWVQVWRNKTGTYAGFLQDVDRVWLKLREANTFAARQEQEASYIGQEILCALCHASINSLTENIPNKLLSLLLQHKVWGEEQVIAHIRQIGDIRECARAVDTIYAYLSHSSRIKIFEEMLTNIKQMSNEVIRGEVLVIIADHSPNEALALAQQISHEQIRAEVLIAVAAHLPNEALALARQISREQIRAEVLVAVTSYLRQEVLAEPRQFSYARLIGLDPFLPKEILPKVREINDSWLRANVLAEIAAYLPPNVQPIVSVEALVAARVISDEEARAKIIGAVVPFLPREDDSTLFNVALAEAQRDSSNKIYMSILYDQKTAIKAVRHLSDEKIRAETLATIASYLPLEMRRTLFVEALITAKSISDGKAQAEALMTIAGYLPSKIRLDVWAQAMASVMNINDERERAKMLAVISPYLPEESFAAVQLIDDEQSKAEVLIAVAPYLPEKTLTLARQMNHRRIQADVLVTVIPYLPKKKIVPELEITVATVLKINDSLSQSKVLSAIIPYLPQEVLAEVQKIRDAWIRAPILVAVAPYLPEEIHPIIFGDALQASREISDDVSKAKVLAAVAPYFPKETLIETGKIDSEWRRSTVLAALAPYLPEEVFAEAQQMSRLECRSNVLTTVAPYLPDEVLVVTQENRNMRVHAELLAAIAPYLLQKRRMAGLEALGSVRSIEDKLFRAKVLAALASYLPEEVLAETREIVSEKRRAIILAALAPYLSEEVLVKTQAISDYHVRVQVLVALIPYLPDEKRTIVMREILATVSKVGWNEEQLMMVLAAYLPEEVLAKTREIENVYVRTELLIALAPYLPKEVLAVALAISDEYARLRVLVALVPHLPDEKRTVVLREALAYGRNTGDESILAKALVALAPFLLQEISAIMSELSLDQYSADDILAFAPYLPQEVLAVTRENVLKSEREKVFHHLSVYLLNLSQSDLYELWQESLYLFSKRIRPEFLYDISALMPIISRLGGEKGVRDTWQAVQTVSTWWP